MSYQGIGHENSQFITSEDEGEGVVMMLDGFELLSPEQQRGLYDMLKGAINVMVKHQGDPERGDVGWRRQTLEEQLIHAQDHIDDAEFECIDNNEGSGACMFDDDGLPHIDHATARIALYYAKKRLLNAKDSDASKESGSAT